MSANGRRNVVITGRGVVSPLATERDEHLRRLWAGASGIGRVEPDERHGLYCAFEARVEGFDRRRSIRTRMLRKLLTRSAAYAVVAAGEALAEAGLDADETVRSEAGLYAGSVCIDFDPEIFIPAIKESVDGEGELDIERFAHRGLHMIDPLFLVKTLPNGGIGGIAIEHQVTGPSLNITNGTVSGLQAMISAMGAIERGDVDVMVVGGCDSLLSMDSVAEHLVAQRVIEETAERDLDPADASRPFDLERRGYALGEAAVFFVLESEEHARQRGAVLRGRLLGGSQTTPRRQGDAEGLADAAAGALANASLEARDITALFGDGMAVAEDDRMESRAAQRLFGDGGPPFTAAVSATGFTGAASGTLSLLHASEALVRGEVPPIRGCHQSDPECTLDLASEPRRIDGNTALVWNSDRGIKNAAVVIAGAP